MVVKREKRTKYFLAFAASFFIVLLLSMNQAQAASKLALFNFATANDLKIAKGAKIDLAGDKQVSSWKSSNPKIVKVSKKGIVTALKPGKAVISAKMNGQKEECKITVVKDVVKSSSYIKNLYRTWEQPDTGKKVTVKSGGLKKGFGSFLTQIEPENEDDVVYHKCTKITAVEEDSTGATIYFEASGVMGGKEKTFACTAVVGNEYGNEKYGCFLIIHPVIWVSDDGLPLYGSGFYWYA